MKIDIISDTICPWCLVGKRRLEAALAQRPNLDVEVQWHPFQLNPATPVEGIDRETYIREKFGSSNYPLQMLKALNAAGKSVDVNFDFHSMPRVPNTLRSHRLIRWAGEAGVQGAVVNILFDRYFLEQSDIGDPEVLAAVATEAGMDGGEVRLRLDRGDDAEIVASEDEHARRLGISGVPTFILDQKHAVSGAQEPEVLLQLFDKAAVEGEEPVTASA